MKKNSSMKIAPIMNQPNYHTQYVSKGKHTRNGSQQSSINVEKSKIKQKQRFRSPQYIVGSNESNDLKQKQKKTLQTVIIKVQKNANSRNKKTKNSQKLNQMQNQLKQHQEVPEYNPDIRLTYQQDKERNYQTGDSQYIVKKQHINQTIQTIHIPVIVQIKPRNKKKQSRASCESLSNNKFKNQTQKVIQQNSLSKLSKKSSFLSSSSPGISPEKVDKKQKGQVKKIKDTKVLNKRNSSQSQCVQKLTKKDSFISTSEILDNRKKSEKQNLKSQRQQSFFNCFQNLKMPKERFLTFLLIYQIAITFIILFCLLQSIYWMLSIIIVLAIPSYFGHQCVINRIDYHSLTEQLMEPSSQNTIDNISKYKEGRNILNTYFQSIDQEQFTQENNSISNLNLAKKIKKQRFNQLPKLQNSESYSEVKALPLKNLIKQRKSIFDQEKKEFKSKFLMVVPYLQQNQVQTFIKCSKCNSTQTNTRIKHCNRCNTCHFGYDHYCKWLSICIDGANYKYFIRFLVSVWIIGLILIVLGAFYVTSIIKLIQMSKQSDKKIIILLTLLCLVQVESIIVFIFCSYVLGYHIWLICRGVSSRQHFLADNKTNQRKIRQNCSIRGNTLSKSLFHSLNNNYLLFFISRLPKELNKMMRQKNQVNQNEKFLCKSSYMKDIVMQKSNQNKTLQQQSQQQQRTNEQIQQKTQNYQGQFNSVNGRLNPEPKKRTFVQRKLQYNEEQNQLQGYHFKQIGSPSKLSFRNYQQ